MIAIREVRPGSLDFLQMIQLRRKILRWPLGLDFTVEDLRPPPGEVHLAGFDDGYVVACLVLTPLDDEVIKMRQVAVMPDLRGKGVGRGLVEASEQVAQGRGFRRITLHARDTAVPFYLALGYEPEGEPFEEVGIPHRAMSKRL